MGRLLRSAQTNIVGDNYTTAVINNEEDWVIAIEQAEYVEDYILKLTFSDGHQKLVDFGSFLQQSHHSHIRKYLEQELFQHFTVAHGDLFWNDYDLCFPIADLYEGHI